MILWRDREEKKKAAAAFKPDAFHCLELGVIDGIVAGAAAAAPRTTPTRPRASLKRALAEALDELEGYLGSASFAAPAARSSARWASTPDPHRTVAAAQRRLSPHHPQGFQPGSDVV